MLTINGQTLPAHPYEWTSGSTGSGAWWESKQHICGHADLFQTVAIAEGMPATCDLGEGRIRLLSWSRPPRALIAGEVNPFTGKRYNPMEAGFTESVPGDWVSMDVAVLSPMHPNCPPEHQPRETEPTQ